MASTEAKRKAQRCYARTLKGRRAAARRRLVWYEQKQVYLTAELRELRRLYWRVRKRCQRQGIELSRSPLLAWVWEVMLLLRWGPDSKQAEKELKKARRLAKELDADPYLC